MTEQLRRIAAEQGWSFLKPGKGLQSGVPASNGHEKQHKLPIQAV